MVTPRPGDQLEELCKRANQELILVSPFIKYAALERLLQQTAQGIEIHCVTRWRVDEIANGVSDIDIWLLSHIRTHFRLWLRPDLHAKYYRGDDTCLVGSANLTQTALGWAKKPNLELLVPIAKGDDSLDQFEQRLFLGCVPVDQELYDQMKEAAQVYKKTGLVVPPSPADQPIDDKVPETEGALFTAWVPSLRDPALLYKAYCGQLEELTETSREAAQKDLATLPIITGLKKEAFEVSVRVLLLQSPIIHKIDEFTITPQRFGAVSTLLKSLPCADVEGYDAKRTWQTIMRWLLYFFPERYSVHTPGHSEIFSRIDIKTK